MTILSQPLHSTGEGAGPKKKQVLSRSAKLEFSSFDIWSVLCSFQDSILTPLCRKINEFKTGKLSRNVNDTNDTDIESW